MRHALFFVCVMFAAYPTSFLGPLPASPANYIGTYFPGQPSKATAEELLRAMAAGVANTFYNFSGQAGPCFNLSSQDPPGLQGDGWDVQCCREVAQPIGSYGWPNDMFWPQPWSLEQFTEGCQQQFNGTTPRAFLQLFEYGGRDLSGTSNLLLFSGDLDPWKSGSILENSTSYGKDVIVYLQQGAAHHLDLRTPNAMDPPDVVTARAIAEAALKRWSNAFLAARNHSLLYYK